MLENVDLNHRLSKAEYRKCLPALQGRLHQLQRACRVAQLATLVVFEGWDAAGKGAVIRKLTERLEPRAFEVHGVRSPRSYEKEMPWMWRFWKMLPNWGHMAIFDHSWYSQVLRERSEKLVDKHRIRHSWRDILRFERELSDDRYLIVKFFLHIDKKEQKKRLRALEKVPEQSWQVEPKSWQRHRRYDDELAAAEEMFEHTETEWGPWTLVEATDVRWARIKVFETLVARLEKDLEARGEPLPEALPLRSGEEAEDLDGSS